MLEKKEITKKLIKNMLINFVIFTAVLIIFDLIIYNNITLSLYKDVDMQLTSTTEKNNIIEKEDIKNNKTIEKFKDDNFQEEKMVSPRLIFIERDKDGNILNKEGIGLLNNYIENLKFDKDTINTIYNIQLNSEYSYRGINYEITNENAETTYLQILANVDGEARNIK